MISIPDLTLRLQNSRADAVSIYRSGLIRVQHRWGTMEFPSEAALNQWIADGTLPDGVRTKFAEFDPSRPN